jgi:hypothetical protein
MSNEAWQYTTRGRLSTTVERVKRQIPLPIHGEIGTCDVVKTTSTVSVCLSVILQYGIMNVLVAVRHNFCPKPPISNAINALLGNTLLYRFSTD